MKRLGMALVLIFVTAGAFAHGLSVRGDDCTARNFNFDGERGFVVEETIDVGATRTLKAAVTHAPLTVTGDSGSGYRIEVCKASRYAEDLDDIRVSYDNSTGQLRATGPGQRNRRWTVMYHIHTPRGADIDVETENGPLSIRDVDGRVLARAQNGPLSLMNLSGNIDATTANGPISIEGGSGSMKVRASNGPLSVHLEGGSWTGGKLDAATKNGPLSLHIPRNYGSGVVVESRGRGPVSCRAEGCKRAPHSWADHDDWDDDRPRTIELGSGAEAVRLSTVNGPITIRDED